MPYRASTFRVMIASPSDVDVERRLTTEVVYEWNAVNSTNRGIVLLPVAWETHASPELGERAQGVINRQVLKDCDLLVALFWTRIGSPTGRSDSGTVEEIEEHLAAGKPAMVYFSLVPVQPDSVDSDQLKALRDFREACKKRGLVQEYASIAEFREVFARQLAHTVIRHLLPQRERDEEDVQALDNLKFLDRSKAIRSLSPEARTLLVAAADDKSGSIICVATLGGFHVQTAGREFVESHNPRSEALWRAAVEELASNGLVEDRSYKGEVFRITQEGYRYADALR